MPATGGANTGFISLLARLDRIRCYAASGYYCIGGCAISTTATSLSATWTVAGAQTFTYSASNWVSSFTAGGNSYVVTITSGGYVTITRNSISCGTVGYSIAACPPSYSATITPPSGSCLTELGTATVT